MIWDKLNDILTLAKTRSIQRTQTPPRLWPLTSSCALTWKLRSKTLMPLDVAVLYLGTRYDVCDCNSLRDMTISSFFVTFDDRSLSFLHLHEIVEGLYFHCSLSVCLFVWVSVCVSVCLCVRHFLWTKFQPNGCTDLDAVFAKWLLTALAQTLLNLVTLGQRSRSQWRNIHYFSVNFPTLYLSSFMFNQNKIQYVT